MNKLLKYKPYSFSIQYNEHKNTYETIQEYHSHSTSYFVDLEECIRLDTMFEIHLYPITAIGFYSVCASTYELALNEMIKILEHNNQVAK